MGRMNTFHGDVAPSTGEAGRYSHARGMDNGASNAGTTRWPGRPTLVGFAAAGAVAIVLAAGAYWISREQQHASAQVGRTHEVLASLASARSAAIDMQSGQRGFLITGREDFLVPYDRGIAAVRAELRRARALLADNPQQLARLDRVETELQARLDMATRIIETRRAEGLEAAVATARTGVLEQQMEGVLALFAELDAGERRRLGVHMEDLDLRLRTFWTTITALVLALLSTLTLLYRQVRRRQAEQLTQEATLERRVAERTREVQAASAKLQDAKRRLELLSARLITLQEEERRRVAHELHEETSQVLAGIRLRLKDAACDDAKATRLIEECAGAMKDAIERTRRMAVSLRPPMLDDLGLAEALEWALGQQAKAAGWRAELVAEGLPESIPAEIRTACFRIVQEILANAAQHACARNVQVELRGDGHRLELTVVDDGIGFDPAQATPAAEDEGHFGLLAMAERAGLAGGSFHIDSAPRAGTRVRATFPLA